MQSCALYLYLIADKSYLYILLIHIDQYHKESEANELQQERKGVCNSNYRSKVNQSQRPGLATTVLP
jgi:hypothetical protein